MLAGKIDKESRMGKKEEDGKGEVEGVCVHVCVCVCVRLLSFIKNVNLISILN